jgi:inner membrane protein
MPSIFTHALVPIASSVGLGRLVSTRLMWFSIVCCMLPDLDALAFQFGIPYASPWGHRGFTHSITFAVILALFATLLSPALKSKAWIVGLVVFISTISHPLLDMLTNGGLGVALYWPISNERVFFAFRPIAVSPIGVTNFFTERGWQVIQSELLWVGCPRFWGCWY